jgi:[acyl-carrier-protein] S-malonyltransferase
VNNQENQLNHMKAYLFAGQGSQYIGMGKDLYEMFPESKAIFDKADNVLGFSISKMCFEGHPEELKKTKNCQPAIVTMTIAAYEAYKKVTSHQPSATSFVAGLSLGEYSSLVASGAVSFEDAVYLVRRRGEFMEEEALKSPGKMASVMGLELAVVRKVCQEAKVEVANINSPGQIVISGGAKQIEEAIKAAEAAGAKKVILLEVSGAFHSSFMKGASQRLAEELGKITIRDNKIPVISNVTAQPVMSVAEIKDCLIKQVSSSVLWEDSMRYICAQGVTEFIEFGPGKVLKGLLRRINESAVCRNIEKKEDLLTLINNERS